MSNELRVKDKSVTQRFRGAEKQRKKITDEIKFGEIEKIVAVCVGGMTRDKRQIENFVSQKSAEKVGRAAEMTKTRRE